MGREEEMAILERAWFYQLCGQMGSQLTQGVSPSPLHGKGGGGKGRGTGLFHPWAYHGSSQCPVR